MTRPHDEKTAARLLRTRGYTVIEPTKLVDLSGATQSEILAHVVGSRIKIAQILGISRAAVHAWDKKGLVPVNQVPSILDWATTQDDETALAIERLFPEYYQ